jgi:hypothetical protein
MEIGPTYEAAGDAGWLDVLPDPALNAYLSICALDPIWDHAIVGDLDDLGSEALNLHFFGGLDEPYDPTAPQPGQDEAEIDATGLEPPDGEVDERWKLFVEHAARRDLPMETPRDAIEFMRHIGLVQRIEDREGTVRWRPVRPIPQAEDLLDVRRHLLLRQARRQWRARVERFGVEVLRWIAAHPRADEPGMDLHTTMTELAERVGLGVDDVRYGLMSIADSGEVVIEPRPESCGVDQVLTLHVDWDLFDGYR